MSLRAPFRRLGRRIGAIVAWRNPAPARAPCPVIRVLAAHARAPAAQVMAALAAHLSASGGTPHVWCAAPGPLRPGSGARGAEALLLDAFAPTWEGGAPKDATRAAGAGASVLLTLGDRRAGIAPDLTLQVTDAAAPAGGLHRPGDGDAVVAVGDRRALARFAPERGAQSPAVLAARLVPLETGMDWRGMSVLAFAAGPERHAFFAALDDLGANVVRRVSIDGDRALPRALARRLTHEAGMAQAQLVTTERDATRLPAALRGQVLALPLRLEFARPEALDRLLATAGISPGRSLP